LLIDEAYQLIPRDNSGRDFGCEAVETIMSCIEGSECTIDDRPAIIFAGYTEDMDRFVNINSALKRRITDTFIFENYSMNELFQIFEKMASKAGFFVTFDEEIAVTEMNVNFESNICAKLNSGLSRELLCSSKSSVNGRIMQGVSNGEKYADIRKELM